VKPLYIKAVAAGRSARAKILRKFSQNTRKFRNKYGANCRRMSSTCAAIVEE